MRLLRTTIVLSVLFLCAMLTTSCSEDWDKWQLLTMNVTNSLAGKEIPSDGASGTIEITTNGKWCLDNIPNWVVFSAIEGIGDATINCKVKPSDGALRCAHVLVVCEPIDDIAGSTKTDYIEIAQTNKVADYISLTITTEGKRSYWTGSDFSYTALATIKLGYLPSAPFTKAEKQKYLSDLKVRVNMQLGGSIRYYDKTLSATDVASLVAGKEVTVDGGYGPAKIYGFNTYMRHTVTISNKYFSKSVTKDHSY